MFDEIRESHKAKANQIKIEAIELVGIFGYKDRAINFFDNRCVLIGENGSGKTTAISAFNSIVSSNFIALNSLPVKEIRIHFNKGSVTAVISESGAHLNSIYKSIPPFAQSEMQGILAKYNVEDVLSDRTVFQKVSRSSSLPDPVIRDTLVEIQKKQKQITGNIKNGELINEFNKRYNRLYYPTTRKSEVDLSRIFNMEKRHKMYDDYIPGENDMQDIELLIAEKMKKLKDEYYEEILNMAGNVFWEILDSPDLSRDSYELRISNSDLEYLNNKMKVDEKSKIAISKIMNIISSQQSALDAKQIFASRYLHKLIAANDKSRAKETQIKTFANLVNGFLQEKKMEFNDSNYSLLIQGPKKEIKLHELSSGEKQILRFFANLYIVPKPNAFLIIDEPELSLSITWQKKFLQNTLNNSDVCGGGFIATHSPFMLHGIEQFGQTI